MREVSVRMLHFASDLARAADVDEAALTEGLRSLALQDGREPDWIDWDDFVEIMERLETRLGPEGMARVFRDAVPTAYPELRAFAAVFVRPIPLFKFVMMRMMRTLYRHIGIDEIHDLGGNRVKWKQSIPEPYRPSAAFHRASVQMVEVFPCHLDLPEAKVEILSLTPREAELVATFPPPAPIRVRSSRAVSSATSVLARQLDEAFMTIAEALRKRPDAPVDATGRSHAPAAPTARGDVRDWAERLALSPRQREVFALLVEGRANKDIAAALSCSERNVEFHVGRILKAARVTSRSELLVKVLSARA